MDPKVTSFRGGVFSVSPRSLQRGGAAEQRRAMKVGLQAESSPAAIARIPRRRSRFIITRLCTMFASS